MTICPIPVDTLFRAEWTATAPDGAPVDQQTVSVTVTPPSGESYETTNVSHVGVGTYTLDLAVDAYGLWILRWTGIGPSPAASPSQFLRGV